MNQLLQNKTGRFLAFGGSQDNELGVLTLMPKPPEVFAVFPQLSGKGHFPHTWGFLWLRTFPMSLLSQSRDKPVAALQWLPSPLPPASS